MTPRGRIIAAQGAAVALLVLVVYVTLLREDSGTPLPDIQAPGSEQPAQNPDDGSRGGLDGDGGQGDASGLGGPIGAGAAVAGELGWPGAGGDSPALRGPTPPADQYADAVSGLLSKVRGAPGANANGTTP